MTDSIGDLLPKHKFDEPPEVRIIKEFVQEKFQQTVSVTVQPTTILIHVKSAALAGALRMQLHHLQKEIGSDKRLIIRIG